MDTTIRNLDEIAYRQLKAKAALESRSIGEAASEAIRRYVRLPGPEARDRSVTELTVVDFGPGTESLSEAVDETVYGR